MSKTQLLFRRRRQRVRSTLRARVGGLRPRLSVHRTGQHIYAQIIDDVQGRTLVCASTIDPELRKSPGSTTAAARLVGGLVAQRAKEAGLKSIVFDRGGFLYHGRVKALADAAREGGLEF